MDIILRESKLIFENSCILGLSIFIDEEAENLPRKIVLDHIKECSSNKIVQLYLVFTMKNESDVIRNI